MARSSKAAAVRRSVLVKGSPERAFECLANVERVREWYFDDAEMDFRVGGALAFDGPEGSVRGRFRAIEPYKRVVLAYDGPWWGTVTWDFSPTPTGTRVTLTHEGFEGREEWMDRFAWGWESFLKGFKAVVEGRPVK